MSALVRHEDGRWGVLVPFSRYVEWGWPFDRSEYRERIERPRGFVDPGPHALLLLAFLRQAEFDPGRPHESVIMDGAYGIGFFYLAPPRGADGGRDG